MSKIKACLFDLDGVIVDSAKHHFTAWRDLALSLGIEFTEEHNEQLKGVGRMESLEYILSLGDVSLDDKKKQELAAKKNDAYIELIKELDQSEILPGVLSFLHSLQKEDIQIALGSSSKNGGIILRKLQIDHLFESIIDGTKTTRTKPDPQVFEMGADALGLKPNECLVFEDAIKGIEAARAGGFHVIGVGKDEGLTVADYVIESFENFNLDKLKKLY